MILDKFNSPVEKIKGKPIKSFIRILLHGRKVWGNIEQWNEINRPKQNSEVAKALIESQKVLERIRKNRQIDPFLLDTIIAVNEQALPSNFQSGPILTGQTDNS